MRFLVIIIVFILSSCKYYEKSTVTNYWIDKWNYKHTVWRTEKFLKKNDSLIVIKLDTIITDLSPPYNSMTRDWNK
jgi:hypothetical protein